MMNVWEHRGLGEQAEVWDRLQEYYEEFGEPKEEISIIHNPHEISLLTNDFPDMAPLPEQTKLSKGPLRVQSSNSLFKLQDPKESHTLALSLIGKDKGSFLKDSRVGTVLNHAETQMSEESEVAEIKNGALNRNRKRAVTGKNQIPPSPFSTRNSRVNKRKRSMQYRKSGFLYFGC